MSALTFIPKQIVYGGFAYAHFHNYRSPWKIEFWIFLVFRGSNVPNSVNSHSILLCKQFIWLFLSIQVYFSILCVLRCSGHMCSKMQWSETIRNNSGMQPLGGAISSSRDRVRGRWCSSRTYEHTRCTSRNAYTNVYLQIHYTKLVQLVYLGAKCLLKFPLVVLHSY